MSVSLLTDLAAMLDAAAIVPPEVVVLGRLSDDQAEAVQVRDYGGRVPMETHTGLTYRFPRVQVVVRDLDPQVARVRAEAIWKLFDASKRWTIPQATWNGTEYQVIVPLSEPFPIAHDINQRTQIACNYEVRLPDV